MSHEIMGDRAMFRSKPAWHNLGEVFREDLVISAREAMAKVAGDIQVTRAPIYAQVNGVMVAVDKQTGIYRMPTKDDARLHFLGFATESWALDSYAELAGSFDELSQTFKVESAGVLRDGALAFLCFRGPDYDVKGDEMRNYFAANLSLEPGTGHYVLQSDVRVVCWNTNHMSQQRAKINLSIPHTADAKNRIRLAAKLVSQFADMKDKAQGIFTAFADRQVTSQDVDSILYAAFQLPTLPAKLRLLKQTLSDIEAQAFKQGLTPNILRDLEKEQERYDKQCETTLKLREAARASFENFNPSHLRGTAWAAYNAVTEVADWREGRNADESALVGSRAQEKGRAFEAAMALIK